MINNKAEIIYHSIYTTLYLKDEFLSLIMSEESIRDMISDSDPELLKELESLDKEQSVQDLFWQIIQDCEDHSLPLFQNLCSGNLEMWLTDPETDKFK